MRAAACPPPGLLQPPAAIAPAAHSLLVSPARAHPALLIAVKGVPVVEAWVVAGALHQLPHWVRLLRTRQEQVSHTRPHSNQLQPADAKLTGVDWSVQLHGCCASRPHCLASQTAAAGGRVLVLQALSCQRCITHLIVLLLVCTAAACSLACCCCFLLASLAATGLACCTAASHCPLTLRVHQTGTQEPPAAVNETSAEHKHQQPALRQGCCSPTAAACLMPGLHMTVLLASATAFSARSTGRCRAVAPSCEQR